MFQIKLYHNQMEDLYVDENRDILSSLRELGKDPIGDCGGCGNCGKCRARLVSGKLSEITAKEKACFTDLELATGWFLMCQRQPQEDLIIEMPLRDLPNYCFEKKELPKNWQFNFAVQKHCLEFACLQKGVDLKSQLLAETAKLGFDKMSSVALRQFGQVVAAGEKTMTILGSDGVVWGVDSGDTRAENYAVAVDFGSATIGLALIDVAKKQIIGEASCGNGHRSFGVNLAARLKWAVADPEGALVMQDVFIMGINQLISELCLRLGVNKKSIYNFLLATNPINSHFALGVNPESLGKAEPFAIFQEFPAFRAEEIGLNIYRQARVQLLPSLSATLGGDVAALILAADFKNSTAEKPTLLMDFGVETALVLNSKAGIAATTISTPILDGLHFQMGMSAGEGAVIDLKYDEEKQDIVPTQLGNFEVKGICGSGLIRVVQVLQEIGVITAEGKFAEAADLSEKLAKRFRDAKVGKEFVVAGFGLRLAVITEADIEAVLAVGKLLQAKVQEFLAEQQVAVADLQQLIITGAYGNNLQPEAGLYFGILPKLDLAKIKVEPDLTLQGVIKALCNA